MNRLVGYRKFFIAGAALTVLAILSTRDVPTEAYLAVGTVVTVYLGGQSWLDRGRKKNPMDEEGTRE